MQCFEKGIQRAARQPNLPVLYRFALLRMAELLDEAAPVGVAAGFQIDTQTAVLELERCLDDYRNPKSKYNYPQLERAVEGATAILRRDSTLRSFYGQTFVDLSNDLRAAEAIRNLNVAVSQRKPQFDALCQQLQQTVAAFRERVTSTGTDYRHKLRARLTLALRNSSPSAADWNRLDGDLVRLCAVLLASGRHGPSVVAELAERLAKARDLRDAELGFKRVVAGHEHAFEVVIFIEGITARAKRSAEGFEDLPDTLRWANGNSITNKRLRELGRPVDRRRALALRTVVRAGDAGQARQKALAKAETVVSRILHEHRVGDVELRSEAIMLDCGTGTVRRLPRSIKPIAAARVSTRGHLATLMSPMHYFGLGRRDSNPLSANLNLWTALESLAKGYGQTEQVGAFVPSHVGPISELVGARQLFIHSRRLLDLEIRRSGVADPHGLASYLGLGAKPNLRRWHQLLSKLSGSDASLAGQLNSFSTDVDAAHVLRELLDRSSEHVQRRIEQTAALVSDQRRFRAHLENIGQLASHQSDRMRLMRNRTVHDTLIRVDGAEPLRQTGLLLVDAVLEVLPMWTRGSEPPHRAMHRVFVWRGNLHNRWGTGDPIDPDTLVIQP